MTSHPVISGQYLRKVTAVFLVNHTHTKSPHSSLGWLSWPVQNDDERNSHAELITLSGPWYLEGCYWARKKPLHFPSDEKRKSPHPCREGGRVIRFSATMAQIPWIHAHLFHSFFFPQRKRAQWQITAIEKELHFSEDEGIKVGIGLTFFKGI